jgi:AraC-like DNA-binding protein
MSRHKYETYTFHHLAQSYTELGIFAELCVVAEPITAHCHDFLEIAFAMKGRGQHEDVQGCLPLLSGDVWILQPGQWHAYPLVGGSLAIFNLLLSRDFLTSHMPLLQTMSFLSLSDSNEYEVYQRSLVTPVKHIRLSPQGFDQMSLLLTTLATELQSIDSAERNAAICVGLTLQILGLLNRYGVAGLQQSTGLLAARHDAGLMAAIRCIEEQYAEPLTLDTIAQQSGYTPTYLVRKFHRYLGMPPIDYLLHIRLQYACTLLQTTQQEVTTIASNVGFSDSRYFATRFRRAFGMSPTEFRLRTGRMLSS